jgi:maltose alpha-D-glucosyltransferase / alpha-amylase
MSSNGGSQERWYKNAVIYSLSVAHFFDLDGDGIGDLRGAARRLDYIVSLGVDCVWLLPLNASPMRDLGYDLSDFYDVHEEIGHLGDFAAFVRLAHERGLRVVVDLSLHHTSVDHPWFQAARKDPDSRFRDFYIWSEEQPPEDEWPEQVVFSDEEKGPWSFDERAGAYYLHHYYWHEPDLNLENAHVRAELQRVVGFWLQLGVDGLRIDSASLLGGQAAGAYDGDKFGFLRELRSAAAAQSPGAVFLIEADLDPKELGGLFTGSDGGILLLNFYLANFIWLALTRGDAGPLRDALGQLPAPSGVGQWANFLRNHDELDLDQLDEPERDEVYRRFAPDRSMRIYGRGIRRRLAPMLDGDQRLLRLGYSVLMSLPGAPIILYGDELGMGDMLSLPDRGAVRIAMQWSGDRNAGFSDLDIDPQVPVQRDGPYASDRVNVGRQRPDDGSLLNWVAAAIRTRRESSAIGWGTARGLQVDDRRVFGVRHDHHTDVVVALNNLADEPVEATVSDCGDVRRVEEVFSDQDYRAVKTLEEPLAIEPKGYRWFRAESGTRAP